MIKQKYKVIVFIEEQEEKWAIIRADGQCEYVVLKCKLYSDMYYLIEHNGKYGVANKYLTVLLPGSYTSKQECERWIEAFAKYISKKEITSLIEESMQFEETRKYIVFIDGLLIRDMKIPSKAVQMQAVKQNGLAIQFIDRPDLAVQMQAVKQNGLAIQFIDSPNEEIQLEAVRQNTLAIKYIKMQVKRVQLMAVRKDISYLRYIEDQVGFLQSNKIEVKPKDIDIIEEFDLDVQFILMDQMSMYRRKIFKQQHTPEVSASAYSISNNKEHIVYEDGIWSVKKNQYNKRS